MSVLMTSCGRLGWYSDRSGYRYSPVDPCTGEPWPEIPGSILELATSAADEAGFANYEPDSCLLNFYDENARMGLHQDRDEADLGKPIVSVSFGRTARFRIGGVRRRDPTRTVELRHGDVLVFGGPARLVFHGVDRIEGPPHPLLGPSRLNLTLRCAA